MSTEVDRAGARDKPSGMTGDGTKTLDETVFWLYYDAGYSLDVITEILCEDGYRISRETVRKILNGDTHAKQTVGLRERYRPQAEAQRRPALTTDDYTAIFAAYHDDQQSLSQIAQGYDGYDYALIRGVLQGAGEHAVPTKTLRENYPTYRPRTGRYFQAPSRPIIAAVFRNYFGKNATMAETSRLTGVSEDHIKALIEGRESRKLTTKLRASYGSALRPEDSGAEG